MNWLHLVSYFFGGLFLANVVPLAAGALLISLQLARNFGELHGGNTLERP